MRTSGRHALSRSASGADDEDGIVLAPVGSTTDVLNVAVVRRAEQVRSQRMLGLYTANLVAMVIVTALSPGARTYCSPLAANRVERDAGGERVRTELWGCTPTIYTTFAFSLVPLVEHAAVALLWRYRDPTWVDEGHKVQWASHAISSALTMATIMQIAGVVDAAALWLGFMLTLAAHLCAAAHFESQWDWGLFLATTFANLAPWAAVFSAIKVGDVPDFVIAAVLTHFATTCALLFAVAYLRDRVNRTPRLPIAASLGTLLVTWIILGGSARTHAAAGHASIADAPHSLSLLRLLVPAHAHART
jgi:hypothetical protein